MNIQRNKQNHYACKRVLKLDVTINKLLNMFTTPLKALAHNKKNLQQGLGNVCFLKLKHPVMDSESRSMSPFHPAHCTPKKLCKRLQDSP